MLRACQLAALLINIYTISFVQLQAAIGPLIDSLADSQFSTLTPHSHDSCEPQDAKYTVSHEHDGWCTGAGSTNLGAPNGEYLQIDFGRKVNIYAIATKGRHCCDQYVTSYIFSYYSENVWTQYDSGFVFAGNNNINYNTEQEVRHELADYNGTVVAAQSIRFYPITYNGTPAMRVEVYGNDWTAPPTLNPSQSPTKNPGTAPPTTDPTNPPSSSPTKYPTFLPTITPTQYPSLFPTLFPTQFPTKIPTDAPSNQPTHWTIAPSTPPTQQPSFAPTFFGETSNPTPTPTMIPSRNPSETPTNEPSKKPTNMPSITPTTNNGGEVISYSTNDGNDSRENGLNTTTNSDGLEGWMIAVIICSCICCCLGIILFAFKMKRDRKRKDSHEDTFRMQANHKMEGDIHTTVADIWTNPIHHQIVASGSIPFEGGGISTHALDDSSSDEDATPTTVEMQSTKGNVYNVYTKGPKDDNNYVTPQGDIDASDDDIDAIDNGVEQDTEVIDDIETVLTPDGGGDDDGIDDIDNLMDDNGLTALGGLVAEIENDRMDEIENEYMTPNDGDIVLDDNEIDDIENGEGDDMDYNEVMEDELNIDDLIMDENEQDTMQ